MHAGAGIEACRDDVGDAAVRPGADHDAAAVLLRPPLQPIDAAAVKTHVRQHRGLRHDEVEVIGDFQEP